MTEVGHPLVGRIFGRLTVLGDSGERRQRAIVMDCVCSCGSSARVTTTNLKRGVTSSCGCFQRERAADRRKLDLAGKRFGALTALCATEERDSTPNVRWMVRCDCGTIKVMRGSALMQGEIISCGCARQTKLRRSAGKRAENVVKAATRRARKIGAGGDFTSADIDRLYALQRGGCASCAVSFKKAKMARDHRVPLALGGSNDASNMELLCGPCNQRKHAKDPIRWANENGRLL